MVKKGGSLTESHQYNLEKWRILLQEQTQSGLNVIDWCRQNGYTKHAYYYWKRKIQQELLPAALSQLSEAHHQTPAVQASAFVDVTPAKQEPSFQMMPTSAESNYQVAAVIRKNGVEIEITSASTPEVIHSLLEGI